MAQIFITQILPEKSGGRAELTERGVSLITLDTRSNNLCIRVVARRVDENRLCKSCNIDRSWNAICECRLSRSAYQKAKVATQGRKSVPSWRSERMAKKLKPRVLWIYHEFSRATVDRPASEIRARHSQQWNLWKMTPPPPGHGTHPGGNWKVLLKIARGQGRRYVETHTRHKSTSRRCNAR